MTVLASLATACVARPRTPPPYLASGRVQEPQRRTPDRRPSPQTPAPATVSGDS
ncbi:hypothetical protein GLE_1170 [Lysobacter enzymogenes]|uniref:Uncharacterized protein n=1 Tax=Lysobacter enzymogenes TaxID=69 RepID=A0A0S2DDH0_LYSEN|nr:hypothetical protein GLE_1170 [Lysobacter enzymogenes]